jgi:hypothetical protein
MYLAIFLYVLILGTPKYQYYPNDDHDNNKQTKTRMVIDDYTKRNILFTLYPKEKSFMTHSMVKRMVKTKLQSDNTSVNSNGAP